MIDTGLKDKVVLVTGGNNPYGTGSATARAFAAEGAKVFIHYLRKLPELYGVSEKKVEEAKRAGAMGWAFYVAQGGKHPNETVEAIRAERGQVEAWEGDLTNPATIPQLFDRVEEVFGPTDILVNNAAHTELEDTIFTATAEGFDRTFAVNTRATVLMIAEFARRFRERKGKGGRIVNISTDSAQCFPTQICYGASKAAIEAYTRAICYEIAPYDMTINTVAPGPIQTGWLSSEEVEELETSLALGRAGKPEDIANAVIFLASEQASWVTGKILRVDGGHIPFP
jgi:3-oxoacyl-[acyl-carrier protein] reductase